MPAGVGQAPLPLESTPAPHQQIVWLQHPCSCLPDKLPALQIDHQVASNMRGDPQYALLHQLAPRCGVNFPSIPSPQPRLSCSACRWSALADLARDLTSSQGDLSWDFAIGSKPGTAKSLQPFKPPDFTSNLDTLWGCPGTSPHAVPHFRGFLLHPCNTRKYKDDPLTGCCGTPEAPAHVLYNSWFELENVVVLLVYEVMPACGDGLTVTGERALPGRGVCHG